ncbi:MULTISPECIES: phage tail protein [Gammaproteobacteria]|uniref:phage tail protein n=1 Tax=Gammaproteobacteria TaxID=1236 RepID=UPI000DD078E5|nr:MULTISPECIES: tail fiber protein [Gammaproteobacteria]RTE86077.1 hypothetical protein DQX04_05765 [Aliidiomarina sp. B3213]TCZ91431.1 hypothetical protein EYQ95_05775 [Lysobacter sp. N42]
MYANYVGAIRLLPYTIIPPDWLACDGSVYEQSKYPSLFKVIGNKYGGTGSNFAVPDLQGCALYGVSSPAEIGVKVGASEVTLTPAQMPQHTHTPVASGAAANSPAQAEKSLFATTAGPAAEIYTESTPGVALNFMSIGTSGNDRPHNNIQPSLGLQFCICAQGEMPNE